MKIKTNDITVYSSRHRAHSSGRIILVVIALCLVRVLFFYFFPVTAKSPTTFGLA